MIDQVYFLVAWKVELFVGGGGRLKSLRNKNAVRFGHEMVVCSQNRYLLSSKVF